MVLAGFQALPPVIKDTNPKITTSERSSLNLILSSHRKKQDNTSQQPEAFSPHTLSFVLMLRAEICRLYPKYIHIIHSKAESTINIFTSQSDEASQKEKFGSALRISSLDYHLGPILREL